MSQATLEIPTTSSTSNDPTPQAMPRAPGSGGLPASGNSIPINYANHRTTPRSGINFRLVLFIAVVALPLLGVSWLTVRGMLNKGITWHGDYAEVDLKALGNFPFDGNHGTDDDIPARCGAPLDGKTVELRGFMFQDTSAAPAAKEFQFVYNVKICCFSGPPQVQERVYAHSRSDVPIFDQRVFTKIVGTLHAHVVRERDGAIHSVFDLDVNQVEPIEG